MRTIQLSAIVFALSAIVSCDFIDGPRGGGGTGVPKPVQPDSIHVEFLAHDEPYEGCIPRLAATYDEWTMFEITRPDADDFITLLFLKEGDKDCYLVTLTEETVSFACYSDLLTQDVPDEVISLWYEDGKLAVYSGEVDQGTGELCSISHVTEDGFSGKKCDQDYAGGLF